MYLIKLILLTVVAIAAPVVTDAEHLFQPKFTVSTFTKVPAFMEGCGENFYLSKSNENGGRFIFLSDYINGLIRVNNKSILLKNVTKADKTAKTTFSNKDYTLIIEYGTIKPVGDESYDIRSAVITIKYHTKVIWTKSVIGGGGC